MQYLLRASITHVFLGVVVSILGVSVACRGENDRGTTNREQFLQRAQGKWKLESISFDGVRLHEIQENDVYRNATAEVNGNSLTNKIAPGDFVYEVEVVDESSDLVQLTLTRRHQQKVVKLNALARISDGRLVLTHSNSVQERPTSIEPAKGNTTRVWVRAKK